MSATQADRCRSAGPVPGHASSQICSGRLGAANAFASPIWRPPSCLSAAVEVEEGAILPRLRAQMLPGSPDASP